MSLDLWLATIGAVIGALLGLIGLAKPKTAAQIVRLGIHPELPGGFAEFRATFGGLLLMAHLAVLLAVVMREQAGIGSVIGTSFALGAGWLGAAIGRTLSMALDHGEFQTRTRYNALSIAFELVLSLMLLAPWLGHLAG